MSADRSGCWCADKRQPCSYHEGWGDAEDVCAVEIDGLSAELAEAVAMTAEYLGYIDGRCTGGWHCQAPVHIEGCFALERAETQS